MSIKAHIKCIYKCTAIPKYVWGESCWQPPGLEGCHSPLSQRYKVYIFLHLPTHLFSASGVEKQNLWVESDMHKGEIGR